VPALFLGGLQLTLDDKYFAKWRHEFAQEPVAEAVFEIHIMNPLSAIMCFGSMNVLFVCNMVVD
jgi:hypothetical protein